MTQILLGILYVSFYILWILHRPNGWIPFFALELLVISCVLKSHYGFKKITNSLRQAEPDTFQDPGYWTLLQWYGVAIYTPVASEQIAVSFTYIRLAGYVVSCIMLFMSRWVETVICFTNTLLASQLAGWLDPEFFFTEFSKKKPKYIPRANAIINLKEWARGLPLR